MGRKKKISNALAVQVDAEGKIKYDAIARQGQSKDKVRFIVIRLKYNCFSLLKKIFLMNNGEGAQKKKWKGFLRC